MARSPDTNKRVTEPGSKNEEKGVGENIQTFHPFPENPENQQQGDLHSSDYMGQDQACEKIQHRV